MRPIISLQKGDTIQIISTARKISKEELQPAVDILVSWDYKVEFGKNLFAVENQFAGNDTKRKADLQSAINNPRVKAILCARGGYGTVKIIDEIDTEPLIKTNKLIIGFSDVTVLHAHLNQQDISSVHATMPILFSQKGNEKAMSSLKNIFEGKRNHYKINSHPFNKLGKVKSQIVGGNLSILANLAGTKSQLDTKGKILFIEDLDEYLYHIDRMMMQLKRSGMLEQLSGLIIGSMSGMHDNKIPFGKGAYEIIKDIIVDYKYPVCYGFPVGHQADNRAIRCNDIANLSILKNEVIFVN